MPFAFLCCGGICLMVDVRRDVQSSGNSQVSRLFALQIRLTFQWKQIHFKLPPRPFCNVVCVLVWRVISRPTYVCVERKVAKYCYSPIFPHYCSPLVDLPQRQLLHPPWIFVGCFRRPETQKQWSLQYPCLLSRIFKVSSLFVCSCVRVWSSSSSILDYCITI
jgi:hypothetical protein